MHFSMRSETTAISLSSSACSALRSVRSNIYFDTLNIAYQSLIPRQPISLVLANEKLIARSLLSDITDADLEHISILKLKEYDFTIPFSLISKKDRKLTAHEQLFRHLILDCYRK